MTHINHNHYFNVLSLVPIGLLALAVTAALFLIMQFMIYMEQGGLQPSQPIPIPPIVMPKKDLLLITEIPQPVRPAEPEHEPPPPITVAVDNTATTLTTALNNTTPLKTTIDFKTSSGRPEGEFAPIVRVAATYPIRAKTKGIEGYVDFEFTVTKNGGVDSIEVIYAEPAGYFERASISALKRWKYKPTIVDGVAIDYPGVQTRMTFELEK